MATISVRVIRVPGDTKEVSIAEGSTVADILAEAGTDVGSDEALKVDGVEVTMDTVLTDGARVVIAQGAKGA